MHPPQEKLPPLHETMSHLNQALASLGQVPTDGEEATKVGGIAYVLRDLASRLRALRDEVAALDRDEGHGR